MVKEFTILSIPVEPEKSVLDVLEIKAQSAKWVKWTAHASLPVVWIPVLSKDLPCPQQGYDRFLIILTSRKQPWKYNFVWGFYAYWDL